jgi:CBS domain-containing protein
MKVETILTPDIVRIQRSASLDQAAALMRDRHVGALLVTEDRPYDDRPLGILTDRDLVIQAMAAGIAPQECSVGEIMTPAIATVPLAASLGEALAMMRSRGIRRLAVSRDDGSLAGIVSLDDIVDALGAELAGLSGILRSELEREIARNRNRPQ